ncbi:ABC transporter permease [Agrobacterium larrymoorei]|uniref:ABC transporter permease n=1 Tax=Agrobacterium larrymoorei TaxID=160699 RepID=A0AAF0KJU1_9HYPH|nr:ABC transporter permease [Agrobacterium larrymoorei]WHA43139.1 ABC transporter permease [Agrobacterium larrymoorei]
MIPLILKRLIGLLLTLLVVSFLIFFVMGLLPGDPAAIMLGTSASPDTLAALQKQMGLDQPLLLRYFSWLGGLAIGNMGQSYTYGVPVFGLILERLGVTLPLALIAVTLSILIAVPLGVLSAHRRGGAFDMLSSLFSHASIAVPGFWVGLLLIILFSTTLGWMPAGGFPGWQAGFWLSLKSLVLPALALSLGQAGGLTRVCRAAVLEVLNEDFVRTVRAKGIGDAAVLWKHVLPNALIPVITMIGLQFTFLIAGAVLVENVFNLPGLGRLAYQALTQRDIVVMQAVVLFFCALVIVMNFLVDLAYLVIDPRLRGETR